MSEQENNLEVIEGMFDITDEKLLLFLGFCEKNITDKILDRCNIETIPERLNSLIQEFLIEQYNLNKDGVGEGKKQVSSVSDVNQTVSFQTVGGASSMAKNVNEFLDRNMDTLVKYRKIGW